MAPDPPVHAVDDTVSRNYDVAVDVPNSDDSDNEAEDVQDYDGYTLLGQQEVLGGTLDNSEDSDAEPEERIQADVLNSAQSVQEESETLPEAGRAELLALWNSTPVEVTANSIAMDDERSAQIKAAMAGFSLPPSAVPAWASNIPEELWKEKILGRLHQHPDMTENTER